MKIEIKKMSENVHVVKVNGNSTTAYGDFEHMVNGIFNDLLIFGDKYEEIQLDISKIK